MASTLSLRVGKFLFNFQLQFPACRILVHPPGIKPGSPAVEAWSPNHWTAREFQQSSTLKGDPQGGAHLKENQLHGDTEPRVLREHPDGPSCRELGTRGRKTTKCAGEAGRGRGPPRPGQVRSSRKCVRFEKRNQKQGGSRVGYLIIPTNSCVRSGWMSQNSPGVGSPRSEGKAVHSQ